MYNFNFKSKTANNKKNAHHFKLKLVAAKSKYFTYDFKRVQQVEEPRHKAESYLASKRRAIFLSREPAFGGLLNRELLRGLLETNYGYSAINKKAPKQDLVVRQTLNDFFFAPSFFLKVNKNSR